MLDVHRLSFGAPDQGQPLPTPMLQRMEMLFATSFADVRVHLGDEPATIGTHAFVHGSDIYVMREAWDPDSPACWELIGHELAQVRQARRGWMLAPEGLGVRLLHDPVLQAEAQRMAALARRAFKPEATLPQSRQRPAGPPRWDLVLA